MNIKHRLFISHALMILLPLAFSEAVFWFILPFSHSRTDYAPTVDGHMVAIYDANGPWLGPLFWVAYIGIIVLSNVLLTRHLTRHVDQMVESLKRSENSRRELVAGMSHDLRTPLTSIKAYIEGLRKGIATTPEMQNKYLDVIAQKADDMNYLIGQLFTFSKIDTLDFPLAMESVFIVRELSILANTHFPELDKVQVELDKVQFRNIVTNILSNSQKYAQREDVRVHISLQVERRQIRITFTDNGPGVPEDMLPKLFDVFYRGDAARSHPNTGSGLGLPICAKLVARFGGTIVAHNEKGGGLAVCLTLPIQ